MNRLEESRNIFDTIVNNRHFSRISFILFLNKMDLLEEKVGTKRGSIADHFSEEFADQEEVRRYVKKFGGDPHSIDDVKNFILYLFLSRERCRMPNRPLYHHFTTAVDTRNIEYVFRSVKDMVLRSNLDDLMLQ